MNGNPPAVSVVTATYNNERFISAAVESVLGQTFKDLEYLVVNDASTDRTPGILEKHRKTDDRMKVIHNRENLRPAKSRNIAFREAKGRYIAVLDGDDISHPQRLEKQISYMEENPGIGILGTRALIIDEAGRGIMRTRRHLDTSKIKDYLLDTGFPLVHSSLMFRAQVIEDLKGYDENWVSRHDYELCLRAAFAGISFGFLQDCLVSRRYHESSFSLSSRDLLVTNMLLRAKYRSVERGLRVDLPRLKREIEKSPVFARYMQDIDVRRKAKSLVGRWKSGDRRGILADLKHIFIGRLGLLFTYSRSRLNRELDHLSELCISEEMSPPVRQENAE